MAQRFTYKPALLRAACDWVLDGTRLTGPRTDLELPEVTAARFVESSVQTLRHRRLDLYHPSGTVRLSANLPRSSGPTEPNRAAHRSLMLAVAEALPPDTPVAIGEAPALRGLKFGIGVFAVLMGGGLAVTAMTVGMNRNAITEAGLGMAALTLFGLWYAARNAPWVRQQEVPAETLPMLIRVLDGVLPEDDAPRPIGA